MPRILELQKVGDGIGVILDVSFLAENRSIQVLDEFDILRLRRESEETGAQDERGRLNTEEREREVHTELVNKLSAVHRLLAKHRDQLENIAWEIGQLLDTEEYEQ